MNTNNQIQNNNTSTKAVIHQETVCFSGPMPHPDILKKYDEVYPGAAKFIIDMAKNQSDHRQILEKKVICSDITNSRLGLSFGFIIGMTGIVGGAVIVMSGMTITGGLFTAMSLGSLVGTFVYGSQGRAKERNKKRSDDDNLPTGTRSSEK